MYFRKKISSFEKKFKVKLPEDYRNYLKIIGNGGSGPNSSHGISKIEYTYPVRGIYYPYDKRTAFRKMKKKFPYVENAIENDKMLDSLWSSSVKKNNMFEGSLILVNQGCGHYSILEVTGENPGRIWEYVYDFYPIGNNFYDWFNDWVDEEIINIKKYENQILKLQN